jgi:hypothetical protein
MNSMRNNEKLDVGSWSWMIDGEEALNARTLSISSISFRNIRNVSYLHKRMERLAHSIQGAKLHCLHNTSTTHPISFTPNPPATHGRYSADPSLLRFLRFFTGLVAALFARGFAVAFFASVFATAFYAGGFAAAFFVGGAAGASSVGSSSAGDSPAGDPAAGFPGRFRSAGA